MKSEECECLFSDCAKRCAQDVVTYCYRGIFDECNGDLDKFFSKIHEIDDVDAEIIESGKVYDLIFEKCLCPIHTDAGVTSANLCTCSNESIKCVFEQLVPDREVKIEQVSTILAGGEKCRYRITFI